MRVAMTVDEDSARPGIPGSGQTATTAEETREQQVQSSQDEPHSPSSLSSGHGSVQSPPGITDAIASAMPGWEASRQTARARARQLTRKNLTRELWPAGHPKSRSGQTARGQAPILA